MDYLFIDAGNTTVDFRIYNTNNDQIIKIIRPLTQDEYYKNVQNLDEFFIKKNVIFSKIIYSSVVPEWSLIINELSQLRNVEITNIKEINLHDLNKFKIDKFEILGGDFVANYYGGVGFYNEKNLIIVSLGTASTISIIKDSNFIGTVISPGLETSLNGLISKAALLKNFKYEKAKIKIGTNTIDAISIGIYNMHYLMIKSYVNLLSNEYKINKIIFTGGYSKNFIEEINSDNYVYDEELIFKGLKYIINKS
ncbi:type III pantothenate kinase [Spiroplasma litorale]|uniref:Type III pantothenate kinase n=1 Tax=Spiroplasma litorale TaxID=216942 RepID=A0A0K1W0H1_9MOLU|nr:type III pantothenate kinase [Spiroplasma litorale]AKX33800.1 type III pantothenate kinase [Spiroplasma litorale]